MGKYPHIGRIPWFFIKALLREKDVTDLVEKQGWTGWESYLVARMTRSVVENLPEPVIIVERMGKMGRSKIILNPKENRRHYGDLLEKYS